MVLIKIFLIFKTFLLVLVVAQNQGLRNQQIFNKKIIFSFDECFPSSPRLAMESLNVGFVGFFLVVDRRLRTDQ